MKNVNKILLITLMCGPLHKATAMHEEAVTAPHEDASQGRIDPRQQKPRTFLDRLLGRNKPASAPTGKADPTRSDRLPAGSSGLTVAPEPVPADTGLQVNNVQRESIAHLVAEMNKGRSSKAEDKPTKDLTPMLRRKRELLDKIVATDRIVAELKDQLNTNELQRTEAWQSYQRARTNMVDALMKNESPPLLEQAWSEALKNLVRTLRGKLNGNLGSNPSETQLINKSKAQVNKALETAQFYDLKDTDAATQRLIALWKKAQQKLTDSRIGESVTGLTQLDAELNLQRVTQALTAAIAKSKKSPAAQWRWDTSQRFRLARDTANEALQTMVQQLKADIAAGKAWRTDDDEMAFFKLQARIQNPDVSSLKDQAEWVKAKTFDTLLNKMRELLKNFKPAEEVEQGKRDDILAALRDSGLIDENLEAQLRANASLSSKELGRMMAYVRYVRMVEKARKLSTESVDSSFDESVETLKAYIRARLTGNDETEKQRLSELFEQQSGAVIKALKGNFSAVSISRTESTIADALKDAQFYDISDTDANTQKLFALWQKAKDKMERVGRRSEDEEQIAARIDFDFATQQLLAGIKISKRSSQAKSNWKTQQQFKKAWEKAKTKATALMSQWEANLRAGKQPGDAEDEAALNKAFNAIINPTDLSLDNMKQLMETKSFGDTIFGFGHPVGSFDEELAIMSKAVKNMIPKKKVKQGLLKDMTNSGLFDQKLITTLRSEVATKGDFDAQEKTITQRLKEQVDAQLKEWLKSLPEDKRGRDESAEMRFRTRAQANQKAMSATELAKNFNDLTAKMKLEELLDFIAYVKKKAASDGFVKFPALKYNDRRESQA